MVTAWEAQQQDPSVTLLAFDEQLALLVDAEWLARGEPTVGLGSTGSQAAPESVSAIMAPGKIGSRGRLGEVVLCILQHVTPGGG